MISNIPVNVLWLLDDNVPIGYVFTTTSCVSFVFIKIEMKSHEREENTVIRKRLHDRSRWKLSNAISSNALNKIYMHSEAAYRFADAGDVNPVNKYTYRVLCDYGAIPIYFQCETVTPSWNAPFWVRGVMRCNAFVPPNRRKRSAIRTRAVRDRRASRTSRESDRDVRRENVLRRRWRTAGACPGGVGRRRGIARGKSPAAVSRDSSADGPDRRGRRADRAADGRPTGRRDDCVATAGVRDGFDLISIEPSHHGRGVGSRPVRARVSPRASGLRVLGSRARNSTVGSVRTADAEKMSARRPPGDGWKTLLIFEVSVQLHERPQTVWRAWRWHA